MALQMTSQENGEEDEDGGLALVNMTEKALQIRDKDLQSITKGTAKSGAEYFAARSFHGLDIHSKSSLPEPILAGRTGRASGYEDEKTKW
ncbi:unnamed protein product [Ilex paraguariensis]|uniref:Uncharacterized protein n=1 Tax=Ilex paraguariensis TaxID=185542 RepID=A0ABC8U620_9AQUA